jgi:uncharacterized protein with HEPN domain
MRDEDRIRLRHMLDAARESLAFAEGATRADLDADRKLVMAAIKCVEIIGEAANSISDETRTAIPGIPWRVVINMRHRLVHAYFDINLDILWSTLRVDLPPLIETLEKALRER